MGKRSKARRRQEDDTVLPMTAGALGSEKPKKRIRAEPPLDKAAEERKIVNNEPSTTNVLPALRENPKPPASNLAGIPDLQLRSSLGVKKSVKKSCRAQPFQDTNASNCIHFVLDTGAYEWVHFSKDAVSMLLYTSFKRTPAQGANTDEARATSHSTQRRKAPMIMLDPDVAARSFFCRADVIINNVLVPTNSAANQVFTVLPRYQAIFYPEDAKNRKQHFKVLSEWDADRDTDLMNEATKFFAHSEWNDTQYIRVHVPLDGIFPFDTKAAVHQAIEGAKPQVLFLPPSTRIELKLYFHQTKMEALFHNEVNAVNYFDLTHNPLAAAWNITQLQMTLEQAVLEYTSVELFPEQHAEQMKLYRGERLGYWDYDITRAQHQSILAGTSYAEANFQLHPYCRSLLIAFQPDHAVLVQPHKKRPLTGWSTFPLNCTKITTEYANTVLGNDLINFGVRGTDSELSMEQFYESLKELRLADNFTFQHLFPRQSTETSLVQYLVYDVRHLMSRTMQTLRIGMEFNGATTSPANHQVVCLSFHPNGRAEIRNHSSEGTDWEWSFLQTG